MSELAQSLLQESGKQLLIPGQVWSDRLVPEQQKLARAMASLTNRLIAAQQISLLASHGVATRGLATFTALEFSLAELVVQGPGVWGYDPETGQPSSTLPVLRDSGLPRPWLLEDGRIVESIPGDDLTLPDYDLCPQTVWFIPNPLPASPVLFWAVNQQLVEGQGFLVRGNWIALFQNPLQLWPDGVIPCMAVPRNRSWRSGALRADAFYGHGRLLSRYQRNNQTPKALELALCELAGLPVLETEGVVTHIELVEGLVYHQLADGRRFVLPGSTPYAVGSTVPALDGHILRVRSELTHGSRWWANRYWGAAGSPIHIFRPGFYGFTIRDQEVPVEFSESQGQNRAKLILNQDPTAEDLYWSWQEEQEDRMAVETWAEDVIGLDEDDLQPVLQGDGTPVLQADGDPIFATEPTGTLTRNALELFAGVCGTWLGVVETSLDLYDPAAFRRILDYAARERPSGMLLYVAGQGVSFTDPQQFDSYVQTGVFQPAASEPVPCLPH